MQKIIPPQEIAPLSYGGNLVQGLPQLGLIAGSFSVSPEARY